MSEEALDWKRVADYVRRARIALGLRQGDLGVSVSTIYKIENAREDSYSESNLRKIERALHWSVGDIEKIGRGEEPVEAAADEGDVGERVSRLERLMAEQARRLERLERALGDAE